MSRWIETERLILRPFKLNDWRNILKYTGNAEVWKFIAESPHSEQDARQFVALNVELQLKREGFGEHIPVVLKPDHNIIGHMFLRLNFPQQDNAELGFVFDTCYQGKGYAFEAAIALLNYGFNELGLHRVIASCDSRNIAAVKVLEKLGFRREGYFKEAIILNDEWQDQCCYAMLSDEWDNRVI